MTETDDKWRRSVEHTAENARRECEYSVRKANEAIAKADEALERASDALALARELKERLPRIESAAYEGIDKGKEALTLLRERGPKRERFEEETRIALAALAAGKGESGPTNVWQMVTKNPTLVIAIAWVLLQLGINPVELLK